MASRVDTVDTGIEKGFERLPVSVSQISIALESIKQKTILLEYWHGST